MAAVDYFLKLEGIEGESTDSKHKNEIDILSWSWGQTNAGAGHYGTGSGAGKVSMHDFNFTMRVNKASPKLMLACSTGKHISKAVLTCRKAGEEQQEYLKVTMSEVLVSSYQTGGSSGEVVPVETIALNFSKIEQEYSPQDEKGKLTAAIKAGWNVKENRMA
jgi:type VI secretion system secreted protein Hcp